MINAIRQIKHGISVNKTNHAIYWIVNCPVDSVGYALNNLGLAITWCYSVSAARIHVAPSCRANLLLAQKVPVISRGKLGC